MLFNESLKVLLSEVDDWFYIGDWLTECGKVYTFGEGGNGQLGHKNKYFYCETPVWLNFKHKVTQIAAGENHTALVTGKYS